MLPTRLDSETTPKSAPLPDPLLHRMGGEGEQDSCVVIHPNMETPRIVPAPLTRPLLALLFSSALGVTLVVIRILATQRLQHIYLIGNLILAWVPLLASIVLDRWDGLTVARWKRLAAFAVWFLFFPNAPYILTDLVHLGPRYHGHYWVDMLLILLFALTGLVLGFLSLRSMQRRVERRSNWIGGWIFVAGMSLLCGVGIYAGRFLRWNSWDVIARPMVIAGDVKDWVIDPFYRPLSIVFPILFAVFLFTIYMTLLAVAAGERFAHERNNQT